jgi:OmpA-OmpF porin, OOP family
MKLICIKKLSVIGIFCLIAEGLFAQGTILERQAEKTKEKIKQRTENKIEREIDKGLDKTEEEINQAGKKSSNKKEAAAAISTNEQVSETYKVATNASTKKQDGIVATSKFDFISGEKVLVYEDFASTEIGDFPVQFNTNSSGEVVRIEGEANKYLKLANQGIYLLDGLEKVPENFTLEFDVIATENYSENMSGLKLYLVKQLDSPLTFDQHFNSSTQVGIDIHPTLNHGYASIWAMDESDTEFLRNEAKMEAPKNMKYHVSIWRQNTRYRVYIDENKVFDVPRAAFKDVNYQLLFANYSFEGDLFLGNIRYAVGAPDTRSKLITEGKLVTRGILFDSNSDQLKPESVGVLKEIATILAENPTVKVKIVGHTDADGEEKANLELSKKRAAAVKNALVTTFKIDASRLETDGKGEAEPTDPNTTAVGKANNRRVEFIKL